MNRARARETVFMNADRKSDTTIRGGVLSTQSYTKSIFKTPARRIVDTSNIEN